MNSNYLRFYVRETQKHGQQPIFEWLLNRARAMGIPGGSAFRAVASYGQHGVLHEARFIELVPDLTIEVQFIVSDADADRLMDMLRQEKVNLVYARTRAESGRT